MSIQITITLDGTATLNEMLTRAGFLSAPTTAPGASVHFTPHVANRIAEIKADLLVENETPAADALPVTAVSNVVDQPKKAGRPRKNPEAPVAEPKPELVVEPSLPEYTVRRYDGQTDMDTMDSGVATARLVELIHNAGERGALKALMAANEELFLSLPEERRKDITGAVFAANENFDAEDAKAAADKPAPEPEKPSLPVYHKPDGTTLTAITADKAGAQAAILAIAGGAVPKLGFIAAKALLAEFGVEKVSALPDGDARLAQLAEKGAVLLGLPMVGA